MSFLIPPYLKPGDTIAMVSPAGSVKDYDRIEKSAQYLEKKGFKVFIHPQAFMHFGNLAGKDEMRLRVIQYLLETPEIKAIWAVRGGYGSIRIADKINWNALRENPKWIIGFSDITVFHRYLYEKGVASVHGPMPVQWDDSFDTYYLDLLTDMISGVFPIYSTPRDSQNMRERNISGILTGGNAATLASVLTRNSFKSGTVLFLEDVDEHLYALDRIFKMLDRQGAFHSIEALIIGAFTSIKQDLPPFPYSIKQIVRQTVEKYDFPVFFGFPAGHISENHPLMFGKEVRIEVGEKNWEMIFK